MNGKKEYVGMEQLQALLEHWKTERSLSYGEPPQLPHLIIPMDRGNGQTTWTACITDYLETHRMRRFAGLQPFYEHRITGEEKEADEVFFSIRENAVYSNRYQGVEAIDLTSFVPCYSEKLMNRLQTELKEAAESMTLLLFVPERGSERRERVEQRLLDSLPGAVVFPREPYTAGDLARIACGELQRSGILQEEDAGLYEHLCTIFAARGKTTAADAVTLGQEIVRTLLQVCAAGRERGFHG